MRILLLSVVLILTNQANAQSWDTVGSGLDGRVRCFYSDSVANKLYVGGSFHGTNEGKSLNGIATWNQVEWDSLSEGTVNCSSASCYPVLSIEQFNGHIYAGGIFSGMQNVWNTIGIARWDDTTWSSLGNVYANSGMGYVNDMIVYNSELFIIGNFDSVGGVSAINIAAYNGSTWRAVADTLFENYVLKSLAAYQGKLVVGGARWNVLGTTASIFEFDGSIWTDIGLSDFTDTTSMIFTMQVYQNELFVGGTFSASAGAPDESVARWNGSAWTGVGGGILDTLNNSASVLSMCVYDNKLVVGGGFKKAGGIYAHNIVFWDGNLWCGVGKPFPVYVEALISHDDTLYAGGGFTSVEGDYNHRYLAKWVMPNAVDTCGVMGIENIENVTQVAVYPNPANEVVTFQFSEGNLPHSLIIHDQLGREVWRNESSASMVEFPANVFANGVYYYFIVFADDYNTNGKFVIQR